LQFLIIQIGFYTDNFQLIKAGRECQAAVATGMWSNRELPTIQRL